VPKSRPVIDYPDRARRGWIGSCWSADAAVASDLPARRDRHAERGVLRWNAAVQIVELERA
jgi:hypothetical protein